MQKKLLIIGFVWPEPKSSAAGSRMMQLIHAFKVRDYAITFVSSALKNDKSFNLDKLGVSQAEIELNSSSFNDFVKNLNPDVVLFDRFMTEEQFGWRVEEQCPDALKILDTEDLHCLRKAREQACKDKNDFNKSYLYNETAKREIASILRCDLSLIISEAEMDILKNWFKIDDVLLGYLPFMLEEISQKEQALQPKFDQRNHFIFIGNFLHPPNYDALLHLKKSIWPRIRQKLPMAELHIYGAYASQKIDQFQNKKEGFFIKGFTNDVKKVMSKSKVCLVPLQFGAGLKGKMIDAMLNGTPCITTSIGAEGLFGNLPPNGFVQDNWQNFTDYAIQLYTNESMWYEKQKNGFNIINNRFKRSLFENSLFDKIENLQTNLNKHRTENFMGSMLRHHTLQSTKYMSKWIEEKNKNKS